MEKQFLFEGEEILFVSNDNSVTLTSRRIQQNIYNLGHLHFVSMHLENISTIEAITQRSAALSVFGILLGLAGPVLTLLGMGLLPMIIGLCLALLLLLIYSQSRNHRIVIASDAGTKVSILARGMDRASILRFINHVETAKHLIKKS